MRHERIQVLYSGWLGDLVWILPTLHALRPACRFLSLVVSGVQAPLAHLLKNGLVDEVFVDDPRRRQATARQARRAARASAIDLFLDLKGQGKTGLYIPWKPSASVLLPHPRDAREPVLGRLLHPLATTLPRRNDGHMVEAYRSALRDLAPNPAPVSFAIPFNDETVAAGERLIAREGLRDRVSVALNLGSAQYSKIWPAEYFLRLAEIIERDLHARAVIMGARAFAPNHDYDLQSARSLFSDPKWTCLVEETDFAVDAYLLQSGAFTLAVGNDSYAGHAAGSAEETRPQVAGAAPAPDGRWFRARHTISLFGPTNPDFCRPYDPTGRFNKVVLPDHYPEDCSYNHNDHTCPHYGDRQCREASHCMRQITVEQVAAAVEEKLRQITRESTPAQPPKP